MRIHAFLLVSTLAASLSAQQFTETFSFPDGPVIPGWTQQNLTWQVKGQRLIPTGGKSFHYITIDRFPNVADCVVDVDVYYPAIVGLHYGGTCARHPGGTGENGLVMIKLQDNSSVGNGFYNTLWMYERPGGATAVTTGINTLAARVRLIVKGRTCWGQLDGNKDGVYEVSTPARPFAAATTLNSGLVGCDGYNGAEMDNFSFFDSVVLADATTAPKIGTTYKMTLAAPLVGGNPTPYVFGLSLGNAGVPLGGGRAIPLSIDPLLVASLGAGFGGMLTAAQPEGVVSLPIPNDAGLVGLQVFAAGFTIDGSKPLSIGAISNDHQFKITN